MKDLRKIFVLLFLSVIIVFASFALSTFLRTSVDFGIDTMESRVFDLQVKLRNLSAGTLLEELHGWDVEKQEKAVQKLTLPAVSYVFGIDYLKALLSSSASSPVSAFTQSASFPDISVSGATTSKNSAVLTLSFAGNVQMWLFKKENGKWKTNEVPPGYFIEDVEISKDYVSFVLCTSTSEKRKYEFSFGAVPEQYASP